MWKYIKKHKHKILAVTMALLLVTWLGGSALTTMLMPSMAKEVFAKSAFGEVRQVDRMRASARTSRLEDLRIYWPSLDFPDWPNEPLAVTDWMLLSIEAEAMGIEVGEQEVKDVLAAVERRAQRVQKGFSAARLAASRDIRPEVYEDALADFIRIRQLGQVVGGAAALTETELRLAARDAFESVEVEAVAFGADTFVDATQEYDEARLQEQFEADKNSEAKPGSTTFGYFLPPRVKVEYVRVDPAKVDEALVVSEARLLDDAKTYWRENRRDPVFTKPSTTQPAEAAATQPADVASNGPDTQPADPTAIDATTTAESQGPEFYTTFPEAREIAVETVRERQVAEATERVARWLSQEYAEPWFTTQVGEDRYKVAPDAVKRAGYCEDVVSQMPPVMSYQAAVTVVTTDWLMEDEAADLPDVGDATVMLRDGNVATLGDLAFIVQGLAEIPTDRRFDPTLFVAQYQFSSLMLRDDDENLYLFRVVGVDPAHAPESVDLVRDRVIEDLRLMDGLEEARKALEGLKARAIETGGLAKAWEQDNELQARETGEREGHFAALTVRHPKRSGAQEVAEFGTVDADFSEACFALGNEPGDGPKLAILELPGTARVALVQWTKATPLAKDEFYALRGLLMQNLGGQERIGATLEWFDPKKIRARTGFELKQREPAKKKKAEDEKEPDAESEEGKKAA